MRAACRRTGARITAAATSRADEVDTGVDAEEFAAKSPKRLTSYPDGFHIHPKVKKLLEQRAEMGQGKRPIDFGMAEALAFGSLLRQGTPVRLSGQDSRRGTFNQRHAALIDTETESKYMPLHISRRSRPASKSITQRCPKPRCSASNTASAATIPKPWCSGKRNSETSPTARRSSSINSSPPAKTSGIFSPASSCCLPHGYEGQGPEHSSARIERYLQLAARDNIQICQPSTAAQYFHLLRRQALRAWRKPLVVFTPKSMLRNPAASSPARPVSVAGQFQMVIPDAETHRRHSHSDLHGKNRARTDSRTKAKEGHLNRHRISRAALSVPRS